MAAVAAAAAASSLSFPGGGCLPETPPRTPCPPTAADPACAWDHWPLAAAAAPMASSAAAADGAKPAFFAEE